MKHTEKRQGHATVSKSARGDRTARARKKLLALKPHHAKPYRKRHLSLFAVALIACFVLFGLAVSWTAQSSIVNRETRSLLNKLVQAATGPQTASSAFGFSFTYNPGQFYIGAINATDGKLYVGQEVQAARAYQTFKLSSTNFHLPASPPSITVDYLPAAVPSGQTLETIVSKYIQSTLGAKAASPEAIHAESVMVQDHLFVRTLWRQPGSGEFSSQLPVRFVTYATVWQGRPLIIKTDNRLNADGRFPDIDALVQSIRFTQTTTTSFMQTPDAITVATASRRTLDSQLYNTFAAAAMVEAPPSSQLNSALYSPAVVKIYNAYCIDVYIRTTLYLRNYCSILTGSGFFVSADGYIATNGHVATSNSKDLVLQDALVQLSTYGDTRYLLYLAGLAKVTNQQLSAIHDPNELLDKICAAVYTLPDSTFSQKHSVSNLLVDLTSTDPDIKILAKDTQKLVSYPETDNIKHATLIGADYRALDGITKFRQSDVALIKIDGSNYPTVPLGSISEISQGSNLAIMGYPGAAQDNGVVSGTQDSVTLTSGKVSAIKDANGDSRKLIQTDTVIGHGNSGGPALDDAGNVVGIATYTVDASGQGGGVFNYVRDIADLKDLASTEHVTFVQPGDAQSYWQQGITAFYSSHYSKSLTYFDKVKALNPQHPTVNTFIADANQAIKEGKDIKGFPVGLVFVGAVLCLAIAGVAAVFILRHHGKHQVYQVVTGRVAVNPAAFGQPQPAMYGSAVPRYGQPPLPTPPQPYPQQNIPTPLPAVPAPFTPTSFTTQPYQPAMSAPLPPLPAVPPPVAPMQPAPQIVRPDAQLSSDQNTPQPPHY